MMITASMSTATLLIGSIRARGQHVVIAASAQKRTQSCHVQPAGLSLSRGRDCELIDLVLNSSMADINCVLAEPFAKKSAIFSTGPPNDDRWSSCETESKKGDIEIEIKS